MRGVDIMKSYAIHSAELAGFQELKEYLIISSIEDKADALVRKELLLRIINDPSKTGQAKFKAQKNIENCDETIEGVNIFFYGGALEGLTDLSPRLFDETAAGKARYKLFRHDHHCSVCKEHCPYRTVCGRDDSNTSVRQKTMWKQFQDNPVCFLENETEKEKYLRHLEEERIAKEQEQKRIEQAKLKAAQDARREKRLQRIMEQRAMFLKRQAEKALEDKKLKEELEAKRKAKEEKEKEEQARKIAEKEALIAKKAAEREMKNAQKAAQKISEREAVKAQKEAESERLREIKKAERESLKAKKAAEREMAKARKAERDALNAQKAAEKAAERKRIQEEKSAALNAKKLEQQKQKEIQNQKRAEIMEAEEYWKAKLALFRHTHDCYACSLKGTECPFRCYTKSDWIRFAKETSHECKLNRTIQETMDGFVEAKRKIIDKYEAEKHMTDEEKSVYFARIQAEEAQAKMEQDKLEKEKAERLRRRETKKAEKEAKANKKARRAEVIKNEEYWRAKHGLFRHIHGCNTCPLSGNDCVFRSHCQGDWLRFGLVDSHECKLNRERENPSESYIQSQKDIISKYEE